MTDERRKAQLRSATDQDLRAWHWGWLAEAVKCRETAADNLCKSASCEVLYHWNTE